MELLHTAVKAILKQKFPLVAPNENYLLPSFLVSLEQAEEVLIFFTISLLIKITTEMERTLYFKCFGKNQ